MGCPRGRRVAAAPLRPHPLGNPGAEKPGGDCPGGGGEPLPRRSRLGTGMGLRAGPWRQMRWPEQACALPEGATTGRLRAQLSWQRTGPGPGDRLPPGMVPRKGNPLPPPKKKVTVAEEAVSGARSRPKAARVRPVVPAGPEAHLIGFPRMFQVGRAGLSGWPPRGGSQRLPLPTAPA